MYLAPRWLDRNLSRAELIVSVTIIAILIGTFLHYSLVIYSNAERALLNATVTNINTALRQRVLLSRLRNNGRVAIDFADLNPIADLQSDPLLSGPSLAGDLSVAGFANGVIDPPSNYLGELDRSPDDTVQKGVWYYDRSGHVLVYTVINTEYFRTELAGQKRVRFQLEVSYHDADGNGRYDPGIDQFVSVSLKSLDKFSWKT